MTVDMVKTELLFRNIKYKSMEIIDNYDKLQENTSELTDEEKKLLSRDESE